MNYLHAVLSLHEFLAESKVSIPNLPHPPHLAPCDSVLFPKPSVTLKERVFNDITMIQIKSQDAFG
jgi:hypothetical protein